ncbi:apolipoprotein D-like [Palaemon carinicauda]|uniref:apolipoprotein D-like n=1 Tax=Palaemon carinicauda TaxID=392227 RepID=UPI0035B5E9A7
MLLFLTAVCALASCTYGHVDVGVCPTFTDKADFDPVPYLGRWYEAQRFAAFFEEGEDCVNAIYSDLGDGVVGVRNVGRSVFGDVVEITGTAVLVAPGVLSVQFPGHPPGDYHVLDTDYESFACVYNCDVQGNLRVQFAWVLTRDMNPNEATLERANKVFAKNGIDVSFFHRVHQGDDCPYVV